ncbi:putative Major Facilitator Superfamily [Trypanosoma vivax]|uniref:Putative integral membrane transport protein n=1 Tax=Trypanosoma vivax (strain Y486) TaxID=1055687 RepID=G0U8B6_TRYVY|nr:putative Major Facilitator Superfamily [Trypanosoma vivax]CCC53839.1 putative integral membrane transport protein [Trypanosoma vivax Y486]
MYTPTILREVAGRGILDVQLANAFMGVSTAVVVPIVTMVGRQLGFEQHVIANYVSLVGVSRVLTDLPTGILVDYVRLRPIIFGSVLVYMSACALVLWFELSSISLALFCVLSGSMNGVFFLARHIYVAKVSKAEYRGTIMSFLSGVLRWAHTLGPLLLGAIASVQGSARYFFIVPFFSAMLASLCFFVQCSPTGLGASSSPSTERETGKALANSVEGRSRKSSYGDFERDEMRWERVGLISVASVPAGGIPVQGDNTLLPSYGGVGLHAPVTGRPERSNDGNDKNSIIVEVPNVTDPAQCSENGTVFPIVVLAALAEQWCVTWRLGLYIILLVTLRANRKLLLTFAAMRLGFTDLQLSFLLSLSFSFDACLFPLGGIIIDNCSRRVARVPVVLSLGAAFLLLSMFSSPRWLHVMGAVFGIADALGCGLVMTLVADYNQQRFSGLFFGIMRAVQDVGHVVSSVAVSAMIQRFDVTTCCYVWSAMGVVTAAWGYYGVPCGPHEKEV